MENRVVRHAMFDDHASAERAITGLRDAGVRDDRISVIGRHDGDLVETDADGAVAEKVGGIASKGALGAGVGALLGVAALAIPGVGPFIGAGAISAAAAGGAATTGAVVGGAIGGLAGALEDHGIPDEDAKYYEDNLQGERTLVTYDTEGVTHPDAVSGDVLYNAGGYSASRPRVT